MIHSAVIDPRTLAGNLDLAPDGLWWPRSRSRVDYPDEGNAFCFQVEDQSFWFQHRNRCILAAVARFPPPGPVFDIGGGNGFVARALTQAGHPAVVVEPGPVGARNAQARGLSPVICSTLDDAGFHPGALPAAGLFDVLEHIEDDRGVLRRLASLVRPGGRLYVTVPAYQWLWSGEDVLGGIIGAMASARWPASSARPASRWSSRPTSSGRCRCPSCWSVPFPGDWATGRPWTSRPSSAS